MQIHEQERQTRGGGREALRAWLVAAKQRGASVRVYVSDRVHIEVHPVTMDDVAVLSQLVQLAEPDLVEWMASEQGRAAAERARVGWASGSEQGSLVAGVNASPPTRRKKARARQKIDPATANIDQGIQPGAGVKPGGVAAKLLARFSTPLEGEF